MSKSDKGNNIVLELGSAIDMSTSNGNNALSAIPFDGGAVDDLPPIQISDPSDASGVGQSQLLNQFSGNRNIDATLIGSRWTLPDQTFSFPTSGNFYVGYTTGDNTNGFSAFNDDQQESARRALALVSEYTPLNFTEITETTATHANHRFANTTNTLSAYGTFPSDNFAGGDAWFNLGQSFYSTPAIGNWGFATIMHEIGHTMGLKHGHQDYTTFDLSPFLFVTGPRFGTRELENRFNGQPFSLMTYAGATGSPGPGHPADGFNQPQTYMMFDIAALQFLYGANYATNADNTTYTFSTSTGEMLINGTVQGQPTGNIVFRTVWDGGGTDTYDLSNYTTNLLLNLSPGEWLVFDTSANHFQRADNEPNIPGDQLAPGNVANALLHNGDGRSLIENAIGGSGNDEIVGNIAANVIFGGLGNDTLLGLGGNDLMEGGTGADEFVLGSGEGTDTITDFTIGEDLLRFTGGLTFARLAFEQGTNSNDTSVRVVLPIGENLAILQGVNADNLKASASSSLAFEPSDEDFSLTGAPQTTSGSDEIFGFLSKIDSAPNLSGAGISRADVQTLAGNDTVIGIASLQGGGNLVQAYGMSYSLINTGSGSDSIKLFADSTNTSPGGAAIAAGIAHGALYGGDAPDGSSEDPITIVGIAAGSAVGFSPAPNDIASVVGYGIYRTLVSTGSGNDVLSITGEGKRYGADRNVLPDGYGVFSASVHGDEGEDTITIKGTSLDGRGFGIRGASVTGDGGRDIIDITGDGKTVGYGVYQGAVIGGDGNDTITVRGFTDASMVPPYSQPGIGAFNAKIEGGEGDDTITTVGTHFGIRDALITGGIGNDTFDIGKGQGIIRGGSGVKDTLVIDYFDNGQKPADIIVRQGINDSVVIFGTKDNTDQGFSNWTQTIFEVEQFNVSGTIFKQADFLAAFG